MKFSILIIALAVISISGYVIPNGYAASIWIEHESNVVDHGITVTYTKSANNGNPYDVKAIDLSSQVTSETIEIWVYEDADTGIYRSQLILLDPDSSINYEQLHVDVTQGSDVITVVKKTASDTANVFGNDPNAFADATFHQTKRTLDPIPQSVIDCEPSISAPW